MSLYVDGSGLAVKKLGTNQVVAHFAHDPHAGIDGKRNARLFVSTAASVAAASAGRADGADETDTSATPPEAHVKKPKKKGG